MATTRQQIRERLRNLQFTSALAFGLAAIGPVSGADAQAAPAKQSQAYNMMTGKITVVNENTPLQVAQNLRKLYATALKTLSNLGDKQLGPLQGYLSSKTEHEVAAEIAKTAGVKTNGKLKKGMVISYAPLRNFGSEFYPRLAASAVLWGDDGQMPGVDPIPPAPVMKEAPKPAPVVTSAPAASPAINSVANSQDAIKPTSVRTFAVSPDGSMVPTDPKRAAEAASTAKPPASKEDKRRNYGPVNLTRTVKVQRNPNEQAPVAVENGGGPLSPPQTTSVQAAVQPAPAAPVQVASAQPSSQHSKIVTDGKVLVQGERTWGDVINAVNDHYGMIYQTPLEGKIALAKDNGIPYEQIRDSAPRAGMTVYLAKVEQRQKELATKGNQPVVASRVPAKPASPALSYAPPSSGAGGPFAAIKDVPPASRQSKTVKSVEPRHDDNISPSSTGAITRPSSAVPTAPPSVQTPSSANTGAMTSGNTAGQATQPVSSAVHEDSDVCVYQEKKPSACHVSSLNFGGGIAGVGHAANTDPVVDPYGAALLKLAHGLANQSKEERDAHLQAVSAEYDAIFAPSRTTEQKPAGAPPLPAVPVHEKPPLPKVLEKVPAYGAATKADGVAAVTPKKTKPKSVQASKRPVIQRYPAPVRAAVPSVGRVMNCIPHPVQSPFQIFNRVQRCVPHTRPVRRVEVGPSDATAVSAREQFAAASVSGSYNAKLAQNEYGFWTFTAKPPSFTVS